MRVSITKTRLYNFDPLKPHCYIVKLGFTGVYIIYLISAQNINCGYSFEAVLTSTSSEEKHEKYQIFLSENFHILGVKFSVYLNRHVFVMKGEEQQHTCSLVGTFVLNPFKPSVE